MKGHYKEASRSNWYWLLVIVREKHYEMLYQKQLEISQKAFAVGMRIEHSQEFINKSQYGKFYDHPALKAADYKLAVHTSQKRGVYTFCMCPGGYVTWNCSQ